MTDTGAFAAKLGRVAPASRWLVDAAQVFTSGTRRYWAVSTVFGAGVALCDVIGLVVLDIRYAWLWGLLAFVTNYIPNIGFLIGLVPPTLLALLDHGPKTALPVVINPAGPIDWGDLAGGAGYFDQAHLGHEFRAFTGLTPTRYVEVRRRFRRKHPGHALDGWPLPID